MYKKYEEAINYLFFGFLAFLVNMVAYALAVWVLGADDEKVVLVLASTSFAWVVAVLLDEPQLCIQMQGEGQRGHLEGIFRFCRSQNSNRRNGIGDYVCNGGFGRHS